VTPKARISGLFKAELTQPLFGSSALSWTSEQRNAIARQVNQCRREAGQQKREKALIQLGTLVKSLKGAFRTLSRVELFQQKARDEVTGLLDQQAVPDLPKAIALAVEALEGKDVSSAVREARTLGYLGGRVNNLRRYYDYLPEETRQALIVQLQQRQKSAATDQQAIDDELATARQAARQAPQDQSGLRILQHLLYAPVLDKLSRDDARAFREEVQTRMTAIQRVMQQQQAIYAEQAAAEAKKPIDLSQHLSQLLAEQSLEDVSIRGLIPGTTHAEAVSHLNTRWQFGYPGGLSAFAVGTTNKDKLEPNRDTRSRYKAERRSGGTVELTVMADDKVGQIVFDEYYKAALLDQPAEASLVERFGKPDAVQDSDDGRLLYWRDGERRLQVMLSNRVDVFALSADYVSRLQISLWNRDFEAFLEAVNKRCSKIRQTPRNAWSMDDSVWFGVNQCPLGEGYEKKPGL
jgi:hypothetical protein